MSERIPFINRIKARDQVGKVSKRNENWLKSLDYNWFKNTLNGNDEERLTQRSDYSLSEWAASSELFEIASCIEIPEEQEQEQEEEEQEQEQEEEEEEEKDEDQFSKQPTLNALVNENIAKRDEKEKKEEEKVDTLDTQDGKRSTSRRIHTYAWLNIVRTIHTYLPTDKTPGL
ncbi:hypothetical protein HZH66_014830 [Vespula vulgaris]|uniref:Uncharacterized protein n=1 Tax=Vespula vulgaris TaxID=7454 RepID=A0A834MPZ7_VESVU|nr:hypothetical protein HZH66_014830 [Vespula vulgaris]